MLGEILSGQRDDFPGGDDRGDLRGLWAHIWMGTASYTHWLTPNASAGDALWIKWCANADLPQAGLPCNPRPNRDGTEYAAARSHHPGGVHVVYVDTHVEFISETIDLLTWRAIATLNTGETVGNIDAL